MKQPDIPKFMKPYEINMEGYNLISIICEDCGAAYGLIPFNETFLVEIAIGEVRGNETA